VLLRTLRPDATGWYRTEIFDYRRDLPVYTAKRKADPQAKLLFDGVFLLRPQLRLFWGYTILVRADFDVTVTLRRALIRDLSLSGDAAEIQQRYLSRYIPGQKV
jgi:uridine kinase